MTNNKYIERTIDAELLAWSKNDRRKPLLLRGARQVGKSSAVRHLAEQFEYFLEINFEEDEFARDLFAKGNLSPQRFCQGLVAEYHIPIIPGKTLLFLDEIQASVRAISSLRYFYEKMQELHVIAAGSLLEFAIREVPSMGVGRISPMYMYPMNFAEFLIASGDKMMLETIQNANCEEPMIDALHNSVIDRLKMFLMVGGMPEAVSAYVNSNGDLLAVQEILDNLIDMFRTDFAKYKEKSPTLQIEAVFDSVIRQMGHKFVYSNVSGDYSHRQLKEALELLKMAGLVIPVIHTAANGIPLGAEINIKKQKMLMLDTGIFLRLLGMPLSDLFISREFSLVNKGNVAELFVGLEILKSSSRHRRQDLYYWHREGKSSNAEVDFVVQKGWDIIPVEVKSNTSGSMQSMRVFMGEKNPPFGIRTSLENFGEVSNIKIVPLYAIGKYVEDLNRGQYADSVLPASR